MTPHEMNKTEFNSAAKAQRLITPVFVGSNEERHTLIAALRFWQQHGMCDPYNRSDEFQDLATNSDEVTSLCNEDLDALVESLNC